MCDQAWAFLIEAMASAIGAAIGAVMTILGFRYLDDRKIKKREKRIALVAEKGESKNGSVYLTASEEIKGCKIKAVYVRFNGKSKRLDANKEMLELRTEGQGTLPIQKIRDCFPDITADNVKQSDFSIELESGTRIIADWHNDICER